MNNEEIIDSIMDCDCDAEIRVMDSYLFEDPEGPDTRLRIIFVCTGCGKMVSTTGSIDEIADIYMTQKVRVNN